MISILRRVAIGICALSMSALGLMTVGAAAASAAPVGCSASYLCFYADPGYAGGLGKVTGNNTNFSAFSTSTSNGCQADAILALSNTIPSWVLITYVGQQLGNKLAGELATAPTYQAALKRWRTCMVSRGFEYDTPDEARESIVEQAKEAWLHDGAAKTGNHDGRS